jgi:mono/diheme cytochrome c family protein
MRRWLLPLLIASVVSASPKAPPWENPAAVSGRRIFRENCAVCHDIDRDQKSTRKFGPSLQHLFRNPRMPLSKARTSRDYVKVRIQYGGQLMPAFGKRMNAAQLAALLAYLETK